MSELPGDLLYTNDHEWLRRESDGSVTIGITGHAATSLGDLVYVELPEVDQDVEEGGEMAVVESVKAASDVYAPIAGNIAAVNIDLADDPGLMTLMAACGFNEVFVGIETTNEEALLECNKLQNKQRQC